MKITIVDNDTKSLVELKNLFSDDQIKVVKPQKIGQINSTNSDLVILSGSYSNPILSNQDFYQAEIDFIKNTTIPTIGICLGFELICYAYDTKLVRKNNQIKGIFPLTLIKNGFIGLEGSKVRVYENHRWAVKQVNSPLITLAKNTNGIQIVKHESRPLYGLQFHPELKVEETQGKQILKIVIDILGVSPLKYFLVTI